MKKTISKTQAQEEIQEFFKEIGRKTPKEIKKMRKLAMAHKIPLKDKKNLFCKKCLIPYENSKIRVKKGIKSIICDKCGTISRKKIN